jgi:hypothetical protein
MPLNILNDTEFAIDIATQVMKRTNELYEKAINASLQPEDAEKDAEFMETTLNAEALKEHITEGMDAIVKQING